MLKFINAEITLKKRERSERAKNRVISGMILILVRFMQIGRARESWQIHKAR